MADGEDQDSIGSGLDRALRRIEVMKRELKEGEGATLFEPLRVPFDFGVYEGFR